MNLWGQIAISFLLGAAIGGGVIGLILKMKLGQMRASAENEIEKNRMRAEAEQQVLAGRLEDSLKRQTELTAEKTEINAQLEQARDRLTQQTSRISHLETTLEKERKAAEEQQALLRELKEQFTHTFKSLSAEALQGNNRAFLDLARSELKAFQESARGDLEKRQTAIDELVKPVRESLQKVDEKIHSLEKAREGAYSEIRQQIVTLHQTEQELRRETAQLVKALRSPIVRGRWGEVQLRRVVEMAGMINHCDFYEQPTVTTEDGRRRPDLIVRLPGNKTIVVDAKAPIQAFLDALETDNEGDRVQLLKRHAAHIQEHVRQLTRKSYWEQFEHAPEFVVLFLPGESFFSAALEQDPRLIETGAESNVILATPTTLIALLKAVAYGWQQETLTENARKISELGRDLYKRLSDMGGHMDKLGVNLGNAVKAYNRTVGSLESRVLVSARKFKELGSTQSGVEIEELKHVDHAPRAIQAPEMTEPAPENDEDADRE